MKQIIIDPRLKYNYASWYLLGIKRLLKGWKITYEIDPFKGIKYENTADYNSGFAFIISSKGQEKKVFVDTEESASAPKLPPFSDLLISLVVFFEA